MNSDSFDIANDGNLFPREDLLEAVARSDWRDREVPTKAWLMTGIGISLVAAGTPIADVLIRSTTEFAATSAGPLAPLHASLAAVGRSGVGIEAAAFLMSAVALGATLPALGLALRAAGFSGRVAFTSALLALMSPLLLMHGRLPSDGAVVALGGTLLLAAIAAPRDAGRSGRTGHMVRVGLAAGVLLALCGMSRAAAVQANEVVFGRWVDLALLGGGALLVVPLGWARQEEEAPPPLWLVAWLVLSAVVAVLAGAQAGAALVPGLAILIANALARRARPDGALRWAAMLGAVQAGLIVATIAWAPADTDSFAATGAGDVQVGDTVVVEDLDTDDAYLIRRRLGAQVQDHLPAQSGGRVLVLDGDGAAPWSLDSMTGEVRRRQGTAAAEQPVTGDDGD